MKISGLKQIITLLALLVFGLNVYAQQPKTALQLNDHLAAITDSLFKNGQQWGDQFSASMQNHDFKTLTPIRIKIQQFIDKKLVDIKALNDINGSETLRTAMINFLTLERKMVDEQFIPLEKMDANTTEAQLKAAIDKLTEASKEEEVVLGKVRDAQNAYAQKNGFKIEEEKK